jgi:hypothetical protein
VRKDLGVAAMKTVKWAISTEIFKQPGRPQLSDALNRAGVEYFESEYDSSTRKYADIPYDTSECVVMYGPIRFVREKNKGFLPGAFGFKNDTNTSHYMSQLPPDLFFNNDAMYLPYGMIAKKKDMLADIYGDHLFIRPDSGFKSFTGFDVKLKDLEFELSALKQTKNPGDHEMCLIARAKPIHAEYRIVVCENQIVTGSQYRWDGRMDVRIDVHHDAWSFAQTAVAEAAWQLDTCYVVDIFLSDSGPKIGEFNSFASSGLYQCDTDAIVDAVSRAALKEWQ